ncbi:YlmC/YmxH family sporulation protein [Brevibacillus humidisoli]|uniref:YlmC/YmxH family sporulation protein n=1 Tax=Brevibacillus humidisoli TaxID=2895522 RepID=UPI001E3296BE|nr:YlmC/YmxH family sporulation protein [Brevibacillus humidisoli]UFJ42180.1 YlmC/YmxH family sporulation protein [Brevibacillus humidisoli]
MRLSEFSGKEIIDFDNGERMGIIGHSDLEIDDRTGEITSIILPGGSFFGFGKRREDVVIPWKSILKIGPEMIIVDIGSTRQVSRR